MKHLARYLTAAPQVLGFLRDVVDKYRSVSAEHGPKYRSPHEGWGLLFEEVDELWEEVRRRPRNRDPKSMYAECVQIASCALKFALSFGPGGLEK